MITNKKGSVWTKSDRKTLKTMCKEGKSIEEISTELGRTTAAVSWQKSQMGLVKTQKIKFKTKIPKVKTSSGKDVKISNRVTNVDAPHSITREQAKDMASAARQIARVNGKRITMAMFFVEEM